MTLLDGTRSRGEMAVTADPASVGAFGTPTVVHFCATLLTAAILTAPWRSVAGPRMALALAGAAGLGYAIVVIVRARQQTGYKPVLEDWLWHVIFPFIAYATLLVAALSLRWHPTPALFSVGASSLLLLSIGIHNSWDTVTYIATSRSQEDNTPPE